MSEGVTRYEKQGAVARILFDRPAAYNALTWTCGAASVRSAPRSQRIRGARRDAAGRGRQGVRLGTDIAGFQSFTGGQDGVAYEAKRDGCYVGAVEFPAAADRRHRRRRLGRGRGLALSFACDFPDRGDGRAFRPPLARTIGNCLSARGYARLVQHAGIAMAKRMLLAAEIIPAAELQALGLINALVEPEGRWTRQPDELVERPARQRAAHSSA